METPPRIHRKSIKTPYSMATPPRSSSRNAMAPHLSSSPSLLRTPIRSTRKTISKSPSWSSDRFIPNRAHMNMDFCRSSVLTGEKHRIESLGKAAARQRRRVGENGRSNSPSPNRTPQGDQDSALQTEFRRRVKGALLDIPIDDLGQGSIKTNTTRARSRQRNNFTNLAYASLPELEAEAEDPSREGSSSTRATFQECESRLLSFHGDRQNLENCPTNSRDAGGALSSTDPYSHDHLRVLQRSAAKSSYGRYMGSNNSEMSGIGLQSVAQNIGRRIPSAPTRILDAPEIVDDYYLNLISWGEDNILAVALGQCVYLWDAGTGNIEHLVTLQGADDYVTSVSWATVTGHTTYVAVGTNSGTVQLWDTQALKKVRTLNGHSNRIGSLSWNNQWLSSGGRDSLILQHDVRSSNHIVSTYKGHTQEVCGLKWNDDGTTLASGGNENYLCIWDAAMSGRNSNSASSRRQGIASDMSPRFLLTQHKAAVKALAWCPFRRGLLASGGGTADRSIKFWNTSNGTMLNSIDTGSQVCSLLWSKHQHELVSSHGFSENQLILWKYPTMTKIQEFKGHTSRVLHMEQSPDGSCVVSAAADETLRFWDLFGIPPKKFPRHTNPCTNFFAGNSIR